MYRTIVYGLVIVFGVQLSSDAFSYPARTFPRMPTIELNKHIEECRQGLNTRAKAFLKNKKFHLWTLDRDEKEIIEEFHNLDTFRESLWYQHPKILKYRNHWL